MNSLITSQSPLEYMNPLIHKYSKIQTNITSKEENLAMDPNTDVGTASQQNQVSDDMQRSREV